MDAPYATRKQPWLAECQVAPEIFHQVMPRLETCMAPFVRTFCRQEPAQHAQTSVSGLRSDLERKNVAAIVYRFGHDRLPLPRFVGWAEGDAAPLRQELTHQVAPHLGPADGGLGLAPSAVPKSGTDSVGVARQWCGRLGKVDHCHVARALGDVSGAGPTVVALRLSLPKTWTPDKARLDNAGVPQARRGSRSRPQLALDLREANGAVLPPGWVAGADERGRPSWCRRRLARLGERYRLAVPGHPVMRAREAPPPAASGRGRRPKRPWQGLQRWQTALPAEAWTTIDVRHGAKGPLVVDIVKRRVVARTPQRQEGHEETRVVRR